MIGDAYFDKVALLLHMDGANGSTVVTDSSARPKTVTAVGDAKISTAQYAFGGASAAFDGNGDYLSIPTSTDFDVGDTYTIECFVRPNSIASNFGLLHRGNYVAGTTSWTGLSFSIRHLGTFTRFYFYGTSNSTEQYIDVPTGTNGLQANVTKHVAMVRSGGNGSVYIGGVLAGSISGLSTPAVSTQPLIIGDWQYNTGSTHEYLNGYVDEVRITKGVARYTAAFTPPAAAFANYAGQISGVVTDPSGSPAARTVRAYRRDTGALVGSMASDGVTGAYNFDCPSLDEVTVVVLDSATSAPLYDDLCIRVIPA